tara:strand:+ start:323 stop:643 length:321 start_codon:yes stop_codon:yes gene_type:complete
MRKKKQIKKTSFINYYILTMVLSLFVVVLVFNDFGLITYFKLQNKQNQLDKELQQLLIQQNDLRSEIIKLQTDQNYIEQIAREKFMMVKPGERIYRVNEDKEIDQQ